jgi:hypothetical protein
VLIEDLTMAIAAITDIKEATCSHGVAQDIKPVITVQRGDQLIGVTSVHVDVSRETILSAIGTCAVGFAADVVTAAFETLASAHPDNINPMTGHQWRYGEIQDAVEHHEGIARGWVKEAISVTAVNRAGDAAFGYMSYRYVPDVFSGAKLRLRWTGTETVLSTEGWDAQGYMMERMIEMMLDPVIMPNEVEVEPFDRDVLDAACARFLLEHGCDVALYVNEDETERLEMLTRLGVAMREK